MHAAPPCCAHRLDIGPDSMTTPQSVQHTTLNSSCVPVFAAVLCAGSGHWSRQHQDLLRRPEGVQDRCVERPHGCLRVREVRQGYHGETHFCTVFQLLKIVNGSSSVLLMHLLPGMCNASSEGSALHWWRQCNSGCRCGPKVRLPLSLFRQCTGVDLLQSAWHPAINTACSWSGRPLQPGRACGTSAHAWHSCVLMHTPTMQHESVR